MGKIFVLSVTDHEEYILSRIMEIIAAEPGFDHIVSSHPCNTRQTTRPGYFLLGRFMKKCGVRMVKTAEQPLPASLVRSAEN